MGVPLQRSGTRLKARCRRNFFATEGLTATFRKQEKSLAVLQMRCCVNYVAVRPSDIQAEPQDSFSSSFVSSMFCIANLDSALTGDAALANSLLSRNVLQRRELCRQLCYITGCTASSQLCNFDRWDQRTCLSFCSAAVSVATFQQVEHCTLHCEAATGSSICSVHFVLCCLGRKLECLRYAVVLSVVFAASSLRIPFLLVRWPSTAQVVQPEHWMSW